MIDNIINLYNGFDDKTGFLIAAGKEFGYAPSTLKTHWVGGFKVIPEEKQKDFHAFTLNWARQEIAKKMELIKANA